MNRLKNEIAVLCMAILMLLVLQSCSNTEASTNNQPRQAEETSLVILRGKSVSSGIIAPIQTTIKKNVYKTGDTVWCQAISQVWIVTTETADKTTLGNNDSYDLFVIEADNDVDTLKH